MPTCFLELHVLYRMREQRYSRKCCQNRTYGDGGVAAYIKPASEHIEYVVRISVESRLYFLA